MNQNPGEAYSPGFFLSLIVNSQQLIVDKLSKHYLNSPQAGINNVSFELTSGEILAIIGESGSGKSTLLKSIYGLLIPDAGQVIFENKRVKGPDEQLIPGHADMRMVAQDFALNTYAKVYDNIASMLSNTNVKVKAEKTLEILSDLQLMHVKDKRAIDLSGGEQQRVAIARALISHSKMLLFDEPFSQIDTLLKNQLRSEIKRIAKSLQKSIILVSHDPHDGLSLADKLLVLKKGEVMAYGETANLYENPPNLYTAQMLGNAQYLTGVQADKLGLNTLGKDVFLYPEWITLNSSANFSASPLFEVSDIAFKGSMQEVTLQHADIQLRAYANYPVRYKKSDLLAIEISRFITC